MVVSGLALALLAGVCIAGMLHYGHRLHQQGVDPIALFGLRFLLYLPLSVGAFALGIDDKGAVAVTDVVYAVMVGPFLIAFPVYATQKAVSLTSTLTIGTITALGPLFTFVFQIIENRVVYSNATMMGLLIYVAGALVATTGRISGRGRLDGRTT